MLKFECNDIKSSPFTIVKTAVLNANFCFVRLIKDITVPLLFIILLFIFWLVIYTHKLGTGHFTVIIIQSIMLQSLFFFSPLLVGYYLVKALKPDSHLPGLWAFIQQISWPWFIESAKVSFSVFLWYLCLIIPGIIKMVQYSFVSLIVFFNADYKAGNINALKYSQILSKGLLLWLLFLNIVLPTICQALFIQPIFRIIGSSPSRVPWSGYLLLIVGVYIWFLTISYINSILYFIYVIKDKLHKNLIPH